MTRCEACGHPAGEGTWVGEMDEEFGPVEATEFALDQLRHGREPWAYELERGGHAMAYPVHYSPCDEGCRHGGPFRWANGAAGKNLSHYSKAWPRDFGGDVEASWRQVDVRPEGTLCLRCWAARPPA